ncbi:unnamed protein product [Lepeophtheirus salmonis]|uniref:(salmon louse) hypothetical protein n=1 Tax=Lepeophtheirus salmonis TaxID=72036 RepID=A0A7R8D682_LEPSM|nr:unnamed protein product [Lepeophtheirus salmonis]CAF3013580.1 unnamed protein product [Lepeophtheirus salmonis]
MNTGLDNIVFLQSFLQKSKELTLLIALGDLVEINCTSSDSKPAAKLTWFMNGEPIQSNYALPLIKEFDSETGLETSRLGLRFVAEDHHFQHGEMRLTCLAEIEQVWKTHIEGIAGEGGVSSLTNNHLSETRKSIHSGNSLFVRNSQGKCLLSSTSSLILIVLQIYMSFYCSL